MGFQQNLLQLISHPIVTRRTVVDIFGVAIPKKARNDRTTPVNKKTLSVFARVPANHIREGHQGALFKLHSLMSASSSRASLPEDRPQYYVEISCKQRAKALKRKAQTLLLLK